MTDYALVGGDPAPGNPGWFQFVATSFRRVHETAEVCATDLRSIADRWDTADWSGEAADRFRSVIGDLPKDLDKLFISYLTAERAVTTYGDRLAELQADAQRALGRAQAAADDEDGARVRHQGAANRFGAADGSVQGWQHEGTRLRALLVATVDPAQRTPVQARLTNAERERSRAATARTAARGAMDTEERSIEDARSRIRAQVSTCRAIADTRRAALTTLRASLSEAGDVGIQNRNVIERGRDFVVGVVAGDPVAIKTLRDGLRLISNGLTFASNILLVISPIFGPAAPFVVAAAGALRTAAVATAVVALLLTVYLAAGHHPGGDVGAIVTDTVGLVFAALPLKVGSNSLSTVLAGPGSTKAKITRYVMSGETLGGKKLTTATIAGMAKRGLYFRDARTASGALRMALAIPKDHMLGHFVRDTASVAESLQDASQVPAELRRLRDGWATHGVQGLVSEAVPGADGVYLEVPGRPPVRVDSPNIPRAIVNRGVDEMKDGLSDLAGSRRP